MATLLVRWVVVDLVMRCIFNTTLHYRDETCELLLDSDAVIETVNTGLTPLKEVVGAGLSEVPGLASARTPCWCAQLSQHLASPSGTWTRRARRMRSTTGWILQF